MKQYIRLATTLGLGFFLALLGTPVYAEDYITVEDVDACIDLIIEYEDYFDLDDYTEDELFCLFVVEFYDSNFISLDADYDAEEIDDYLLLALQDHNDINDGSGLDNYLAYEEITAEYGEELYNLINQAIDEADYYSHAPETPASRIAGSLAIARTFSTHPPALPELAKQTNGRVRGGAAVYRAATSLASVSRNNRF